ncbi:TonB-dependent receptor [Stenotrophomonas sp. YAU14D1_LEIMI4_1]|uniref:TonB-dependent receptor n=1 Tax=Stenotrophomonas sp. YAU14D1_LEIMI4_1 TaxID=2072407 RepID=UPI000D53CFC8|nr:TonB-dependent receptor [Stenotrophomonas sp. YAU14D1_LEIMI4_1]AWH24673.1 TonB-dependent receptor [Stenotrophomonas sp. YAU14D1_LEIMI4_1]
MPAAQALRAGLLLALLCLAVVPGQAGMAHAGEPAASNEYRIGAGPLVPALQAWARHSGVSLIFDARELADLRTTGVQGRQSPAAALKQLVAGMPVNILQTPAGGYVLRRHAAAPPPPPLKAPTPAPPPSPPAAPQVELAPVQVTGSRLPRTSVQTTLPVTVVDRDDILRSGYGTLFDLLRHLPGMNGHTPLSTARGGDSLYLPVGAAATTSLDGMGPRATLFLVNGRRLPRYPMVSLADGALTDLGGLPLSFIERIELVRGGASAIYGADAMSGVVNIILRDQAEGSEAMLQTGASGHGDGQQYRVQGATGGVRSNGDRWFAGLDLHRMQHVAGDRRDWHADTSLYPIGLLMANGDYYPATECHPPLQKDDQGCWFDSVRPRSLQPASDTVAGYLRYRHERGEGRYAYVEARGSYNRQRFELGPTAVALNFNRTAILNVVLQEGGNVRPRVRASEGDLTVGVGRQQAGRSWEAGVSAQRSEVSLTTDGVVRSEKLLEAARDFDFLPGFSTLPPGLADDLFPTIQSRGRTEQWQGWWGIQRNLMALPGGAAQLATGIDLRQERWTSQPDPLLGKGELALGLPMEQRRLSRNSSAAYAELGLPLAHSLRVDLAARVDRDAGQTAFSPRAGLRWSPSEHWSFLLASGRGFRAPSLFERRRPPGYFGLVALPASDTLPPCARTLRGGGCAVQVDVVENDALKAETSRSHSLAASWTPSDAFALTLTHNIVELHNEILALQPGDALWNRDTWVLDDQGRLRDLRLSFDNIGRTTSRNWVLRGEYRIDSGANGQWQFALDALKQQELKRERSHEAAVDLRGHATPERTAILTVQWQNPNWDIALRGNRVGRMRAWLAGETCPDEQRGEGHCMNPAQLRWNLHVARRLSPRLVAALDVHNVLDTEPVNYLPGSGGQVAGLDDPLGRYFLFTLQFR